MLGGVVGSGVMAFRDCVGGVCLWLEALVCVGYWFVCSKNHLFACGKTYNGCAFGTFLMDLGFLLGSSVHSVHIVAIGALVGN